MPFDGNEKLYTDDVLETLIKARTLIKKGWIRGSFKREFKTGTRTRYCIIGAIRESSNKSLSKGEFFIQRMMPPHIEITAWNDQKSRKKSEVIDLFDRAIAKRQLELSK